MSNGNEVVGIDIIANLEGLKKQLREIPKIGDEASKALVSEVSKNIRSLENQIKKAGSASKAAKADLDGMGAAAKRAGDAADHFGDRAGRAGSNLNKLAGAAGILSPELANVVRTGGDLADVGEVAAAASRALGVSLSSLTAIAGPAIVVVGVLAAAWATYRAELKAADAENQRRAEVEQEIISDTEGLVRSVTEARRDLAKQLGGDAAALAEEAEVYGDWSDKATAATKTLREEHKHLNDEIRNNGRLTPTEINERKARLEAIEQEIAKNEELAYEGAQVELAARDAAQLRGEADAFVAAKATEKGQAVTDATAADADAARAMAEAEAAARAYASALEQLRGIAESSAVAQMDAYERLAHERQAQLDAIAAAQTEAVNQAKAAGIDAVAAERVAAGEASAAQEAVWGEYYMELDQLREQDLEKQKAAHERRAKMEEDAQRASMETAMASLQLAGEGAGLVASGLGATYDASLENAQRLIAHQAAIEKHLTEEQRKELNQRVKDQKKAARTAFEAYKAAQFAQATIGIASAFISALDDAPVPANFVLAGLTAAAGLAQLGAITSAQPAFHSGGALDLAPDEMSITARKKEYMLNPQGRAMYGDDALDRANAGISPQPAVYAVSVYKHTRQVDRWKSDGLAAGDPIARAIQEGKIVGHRSNR